MFWGATVASVINLPLLSVGTTLSIELSCSDEVALSAFWSVSRSEGGGVDKTEASFNPVYRPFGHYPFAQIHYCFHSTNAGQWFRLSRQKFKAKPHANLNNQGATKWLLVGKTCILQKILHEHILLNMLNGRSIGKCFYMSYDQCPKDHSSTNRWPAFC